MLVEEKERHLALFFIGTAWEKVLPAYSGRPKLCRIGEESGFGNPAIPASMTAALTWDCKGLTLKRPVPLKRGLLHSQPNYKGDKIGQY
jgi:hypothetical protein